MSRAGQIFFLMAIVSLASVGIVRFVLGAWMPFMWVLVALFVLFTALGFWKDKQLYGELLALKTTKEGMSMGAMIGLVLVLLVAINFIGARKYKVFDFSMAKVGTLSDQSVRLLSSLQDDLKIYYFYKKGTEGVEENKKAFIELAKKYQDQSDRVKLEFVEVNERPDLAESFGVNRGTGVVFVEYQRRKNKIEKIDEQELTGALVKVMREKDKTIFFVIGHGERDLNETKEATGLAILKNLLEGNRYAATPLNLNATGAVPENADVVVVAGPTMAYTGLELAAIESYLKRGGSVIFAFEGKITAGFESLLKKMGLELQQDYVAQILDTPLGKAVNPTTTPVTEFSPTNTITKPFSNGFVVMRLPSSLKILEPPKDIQLDPIATANGVAFKDLGFKDQIGTGKFMTGVSVSGKWQGAEKPFAAVVFGDADFFSNQFLYQNLNRDLVLNTVATLVKEENLVSITPKETAKTEMILTPTNMTLFIFLFAIPLPIVFLVTSGVLWYRRRYA